MNEISVQRTVDHIFEVCGAELNGFIALSDWLKHHESDAGLLEMFFSNTFLIVLVFTALQHLLTAMTATDFGETDKTSFSHVFPIHPELLG